MPTYQLNSLSHLQFYVSLSDRWRFSFVLVVGFLVVGFLFVCVGGFCLFEAYYIFFFLSSQLKLRVLCHFSAKEQSVAAKGL